MHDKFSSYLIATYSEFVTLVTASRNRAYAGKLVVLIVVASALVSTTKAADITWGSVTNVTGVEDIQLTGGDIIYAFNGGSSNVMAGGVSFTAADLLAGSGTGTGLLNGATTGNAGYDSLLDSVDYGGGMSTSLTLGSGGLLTSGESYTLQLWYTDERPEYSSRIMRYGDGQSPENAVDLLGGGGSFGQFVTGTFTATGTTQTLTLRPQGFGNAHFNALLLQATDPSEPPPPPPPLDPKSTPGWIIDSQTEWNAAYGSGNFSIQDGEANPTTTTATFESRLQPFTEKQSFTSVTFKQTPEWNAGKWSPNDGSIVQPSNGDAGVFISPAENDYWFLNANGSGQNYRAYHSTDMVNWTNHGDVTGENWVTTAEYKDGTFYVYYDNPNDSDPHLLTFTDLSDAATRTSHGKVFDTPSVTASGSDIAIFRDLDGTFHLIREDWSKINARQHSWDSQIAGHATSADGINGFNANIQANLFDVSGSPTGASAQSYNHPHQGTLSYIPHTNNDAWGDYEMLRVGDTYYLFADDHPDGGSIRLGYWYSDDINGPFTYGGPLGVSGHPDPTAGFAEGQFFIFTQNQDIISNGPWVDAVMVQVGIDTVGDGEADFWTEWQAVSETYGRIDGFAKVFSVDPASLDLSEVPEGYGIQFRFQTSDTAAVMDSLVIESVTVLETISGDFNNDGVVDLADYTVWRNNLGAAETVLPNGSYSGDGTGVVDVDEYNDWKSNFGANSETLSSAAVPEPGALSLLGALLTSSVCVLRRYTR